ncbi:hypothetical protein SUGI_0970840 [Cryptomeria japonica]|nr:hypothetical protein SUGI_0970840 [Cryptomeria japonica]
MIVFNLKKEIRTIFSGSFSLDSTTEVVHIYRHSRYKFSQWTFSEIYGHTRLCDGHYCSPVTDFFFNQFYRDIWISIRGVLI